MASEVEIRRNGEAVGTLEIFDAEPSFHLLSMIFPTRIGIVHDDKRNQWIVELGE